MPLDENSHPVVTNPYGRRSCKSCQKMDNGNVLFLYNLRTGIGYSVLQEINAFEKVNNIKINNEIVPRRAGDVYSVYPNTGKSEEKLEFRAQYDMDHMCNDSRNFVLNKINIKSRRVLIVIKVK